MASPQKENGYAPIANEIFFALAAHKFTERERRVLDLLFAEIYGQPKNREARSAPACAVWVSQCLNIEVCNTRTVLRGLVKKGVLRRLLRSGNEPHRYSFIKDYEQWKVRRLDGRTGRIVPINLATGEPRRSAPTPPAGQLRPGKEVGSDLSGRSAATCSAGQPRPGEVAQDSDKQALPGPAKSNKENQEIREKSSSSDEEEGPEELRFLHRMAAAFAAFWILSEQWKRKHLGPWLSARKAEGFQEPEIEDALRFGAAKTHHDACVLRKPELKSQSTHYLWTVALNEAGAILPKAKAYRKIMERNRRIGAPEPPPFAFVPEEAACSSR